MAASQVITHHDDGGGGVGKYAVLFTLDINTEIVTQLPGLLSVFPPYSIHSSKMAILLNPEITNIFVRNSFLFLYSKSHFDYSSYSLYRVPKKVYSKDIAQHSVVYSIGGQDI